MVGDYHIFYIKNNADAALVWANNFTNDNILSNFLSPLLPSIE